MNDNELIDRLNNAVKYFTFDMCHRSEEHVVTAKYCIMFKSVEYSCSFDWNGIDDMLFGEDSIFETIFSYAVTSDVHKELYNDLVNIDSTSLEELMIKLDLMGV